MKQIFHHIFYTNCNFNTRDLALKCINGIGNTNKSVSLQKFVDFKK